jgi:TolB-like protein/Tfp pilus assembly protein PilF
MAEDAGGEKAGSSRSTVFISYASHDAAVANSIVENLEQQGLRCWLAPRDVKPGAPYADAIVRAINEASTVVLVLSASAVGSAHVGREVERAASKHKQIIGFRIDAAPLNPELEYFLSNSQWINVPTMGMSAALAKLANAVGSRSGQTVAADPGASARPEKRTAARRKLIAGAAVIAIVSVAAALVVHFWSQSHKAAPPPAEVTITDKSIAVLPFADMSEKKDQEYFSDGLSEELIDMLTKVPDLRVPARTSSFFFKGKAEDIATIAQKLRVAHVLEGSVRKAGTTMRVTAQLIRADNGYHLWSETYDRELNDVFKVQDEIAGAVVTALKLKLAPGQRVPTSHRTSVFEAYDHYLLGRQFFERGNPDGYRRAIEAYRKAIQLDPRYAAAYVELAVSEYFAADEFGETAGKQRALAAAEKAIELAPEEAISYGARGYLRDRVNWDWTGAQADMEKALAIDSGDAETQAAYALVLDNFGRLPEAIAAAQKATELDPLSSRAWTRLGSLLIRNRQFVAAQEALRRALEIQPESTHAFIYLAELQLLEGKAIEALATFRKVDNEGFRLWGIAMAKHTLNHATESQQALDELIAKHTHGYSYEIAQVYGWRGEKDKAFEWLERSYQQREGDLVYIKDDELLAPLRGDPRHKALLRKMNLPE